jgi:RNA polymerase sigma-70 factor, ECF subfamily
MPTERPTQNELYDEAAAAYGAALERLARAYEADIEIRRDLLQEIHIALWRSFEGFDGRCSLRTWVYRVAHNAGASHALRERRVNSAKWVSLEQVDESGGRQDTELAIQQQDALNRLMALIRRLEPLDRRVILAYLEGMDAASIGEITGISPGNVATKIHRVKNILTRRFYKGGHHGE